MGRRAFRRDDIIVMLEMCITERIGCKPDHPFRRNEIFVAIRFPAWFSPFREERYPCAQGRLINMNPGIARVVSDAVPTERVLFYA